jgi:hypothetical protein
MSIIGIYLPVYLYISSSDCHVHTAPTFDLANVVMHRLSDHRAAFRSHVLSPRWVGVGSDSSRTMDKGRAYLDRLVGLVCGTPKPTTGLDVR